MLSINAVLIDSPNPERLVGFYRDRLGIPLKDERHGSELHWGCFLEDLHFAIHGNAGAKGTAIAISFAVDDVDGLVAKLRSTTPVDEEPHDRPFGRLAKIRDPDGNAVYLHRYPKR